MSQYATMAELLGRPRMFYRSVALERDSTDPSAGRAFVLTPWLERGATEIISGMCGHSTRRAWRLIGDFGVGKSALALALVQALDPRIVNRPGFAGGSNFQIGWSHDEQNDEQVFP